MDVEPVLIVLVVATGAVSLWPPNNRSARMVVFVLGLALAILTVGLFPAPLTAALGVGLTVVWLSAVFYPERFGLAVRSAVRPTSNGSSRPSWVETRPSVAFPGGRPRG